MVFLCNAEKVQSEFPVAIETPLAESPLAKCCGRRRRSITTCPETYRQITIIQPRWLCLPAFSACRCPISTIMTINSTSVDGPKRSTECLYIELLSKRWEGGGGGDLESLHLSAVSLSAESIGLTA